jgi:hypothetical protein
MKTLKFLLVLCAISLLCIGNMMAQNEKTIVVTTEEFTFFSSCANENITGTETLEMIYWENGYLGKWSYTAVGETSGAIYESHGVEPLRVIEKPLLGWGVTIAHTALVKRDGIAFGVVHYTYHINVTPDGVVRVENYINKMHLKCL